MFVITLWSSISSTDNGVRTWVLPWQKPSIGGTGLAVGGKGKKIDIQGWKIFSPCYEVEKIFSKIIVCCYLVTKL